MNCNSDIRTNGFNCIVLQVYTHWLSISIRLIIVDQWILFIISLIGDSSLASHLLPYYSQFTINYLNNLSFDCRKSMRKFHCTCYWANCVRFCVKILYMYGVVTCIKFRCLRVLVLHIGVFEYSYYIALNIGTSE